MSEAPLHRLYHHFSELPFSQRVLFTSALCILGLGYLFAIVYLFHSVSGKDGNPFTLSYDDVIITYAGSGKGSRIEAALRGPMSAMLPAEESSRIVEWVQEGAARAEALPARFPGRGRAAPAPRRPSSFPVRPSRRTCPASFPPCSRPA